MCKHGVQRASRHSLSSYMFVTFLLGLLFINILKTFVVVFLIKGAFLFSFCSFFITEQMLLSFFSSQFLINKINAGGKAILHCAVTCVS